jgi:calcineurin-like phosphoesterase family protein
MSKNIFFISDTHFLTNEMYQFVNYDGTKMRPYNNSLEADEIMIQRWNEMIKPKDKVYHLGDVISRHKNRDNIMQRLNGDKVLIKGNHDSLPINWYTKYFRDIRGTVHIDGNYLLSHFPIHPLSKGRFVRGLHGHTHNQLVLDVNGLPDLWYKNCCVEKNNYSPIPFEVIQDETKKLIEDGIIVIPKKI